MKKILGGFLFFCCLLWSISFPIQAVEMDGTVHQTSSSGAPADTDLYASAAVLMDADSGRVLYGKNENTCLAMASTTKIMTCIVILENTSREDILTVS
ncbi:MAG: D-alanyl-D-alanine carboxypeptidase, partial [Lachnospiraceae bacterium]|nr:D-alanyl-D-alanine carboxypeptidase [Lachnospiraceae bacterium]